MRWITGRTLAIVNVLKIEFNGLGLNTLDDKAAYMKKYKDAFTFTAQHYRPREQGLSSAGVFAAFVSAYIDGADREKLKNAAKYLAFGLVDEAVADPFVNTIFALRNRVMASEFRQPYRGGNRQNHMNLYCAAQAIKNYLNDKLTKKAVLPNHFPFRIYNVDGDVVYKP